MHIRLRFCCFRVNISIHGIEREKKRTSKMLEGAHAYVCNAINMGEISQLAFCNFVFNYNFCYLLLVCLSLQHSCCCCHFAAHICGKINFYLFMKFLF